MCLNDQLLGSHDERSVVENEIRIPLSRDAIPGLKRLFIQKTMLLFQFGIFCQQLINQPALLAKKPVKVCGKMLGTLDEHFYRIGRRSTFSAFSGTESAKP
jgi:hypothetical protein